MWVTVLASQPSVSIDDADDAADLLAEPALLADGVHHLAEQVLVGELVDVGAGVALPVLGLERRRSRRPAASLKSSFIASPDSSWAESMRIVRGRASGCRRRRC